MLIRFNDQEFAKCVACRDEKAINIKKHNQQAKGWVADKENDDPETSLRAIMSEYAASKYFNVAYNFDTLYDANRTDLINGCQVKSSKHQRGHLIIKSYNLKGRYIDSFASIEMRLVYLRGWYDYNDDSIEQYRGHEFARYNQDDYWIPDSDLMPMHILKAQLAS